MTNLIVRNIDEKIVRALKERAGKSGNSAEAEHRKILSRVLFQPYKKSFIQVLAQMPNVGNDEDFERHQAQRETDVFD